MRPGSCGASAAALGLILATVSSTPSNANPPVRALALPRPATGVSAQGPGGSGMRLSALRRGHYAVAPTGCGSDYSGSNGDDYFAGVTGNNADDYAGAEFSATLGGSENEACDADSAIGAGYSNIIGNGGNAAYAFLGGGRQNAITGADAFLGAGFENETTGSYGFLGAGEYGLAEGQGSFVGAGGAEYEMKNTNPTAGSGNVAGAVDSFVGAGDINQISSTGVGSFIGAGGTARAEAGDAVGNSISGADSFIGAGDNNTVSAQQAFIGGGAGGNISGEYAGIAAGYGDVVSGVAGFAGAGGFNVVSGQDAFVGSGNANEASGEGSFVGAGGTMSGSSGNTASGQDAFAGAGDVNLASGDFSAVGGGYENSVVGRYAFDGAGYDNSVAGEFAGVAGGAKNSALGEAAFVGGGQENEAAGEFSFVGAGDQNTVKGNDASILGGYGNSAKGSYATVAGGYGNTAAGELSFAAGYHADATHAGSFVWSDYKGGSALLKDSAVNQFLARASGGVYFYSNEAATSGVVLTPGSGTWASLSDRNAKTGIEPLDDASVLAKVAALPIDSWQYTSEKGVRHVGPMAQDFYAAFRTGVDNRHITSIDEDGVALAAIKALRAADLRKDAELRSQLSEIAALRAGMQQLEAQIASSRVRRGK
jgi:hypothetical protein